MKFPTSQVPDNRRPKCGEDNDLAVYSYENGTSHVECIKCDYLGPGEGSIRAAIKSHNERTRNR